MLQRDARNGVAYLRSTTSSAKELHTVCGVMLIDVHGANDLLPSPDAQTTKLLGAAYEDFSRGATQCYSAAGSAVKRAAAVTTIQRAYGELYLGLVRAWTAAGRSGTP
jgi:hypothetical protein